MRIIIDCKKELVPAFIKLCSDISKNANSNVHVVINELEIVIYPDQDENYINYLINKYF